MTAATIMDAETADLGDRHPRDRSRRGHHRLRRRRRHRGPRADHPRGPLRGAGGRPLPDGRRLRERRVGGLQPDGLAGHAHHQRLLAGGADFPNLPAWIVKAVGGSHHPLVGRDAAVHGATSSAARTTYGEHRRRRTCSTGRSLWMILLPTTTRPRSPSARPTGTAGRRSRPTTTTSCSPTAPSGPATATTPPARTGPTPSRTTGGPPRSRTASTSRATSTAPSGRRRVREIPRALATGNCDLRPSCQAVKITHDARRQGRRGGVRRRRGQPAQAGRAGGLRGRQLDRVAAAAADERLLAASRTGWPTPRARSGATTCGT